MSAAAYPHWTHRPAGPGFHKRERCASCRREIDTNTTDLYRLWIDLLTQDDRHTKCGPCAEEATA